LFSLFAKKLLADLRICGCMQGACNVQIEEELGWLEATFLAVVQEV
jgi:hypothetical protein